MAALFYAAFLSLFIYLYPGGSDFDMSFVIDEKGLILEGFILTIIISIIALFLSIISGFILYLLVNSKFRVVRHIATIYNEAIFGIPLVVFLTFMYFFIFAPVRFIPPTYVGVLAISLYMAPYMKNVFEGAIKSIDENQYQAMTVFGFTTYQKYRYIILPQLVKVIIPPLIGNFSYVIKSSTLLHVMLVDELYSEISKATIKNLRIMEGYTLMVVLYLIITIPLLQLAKWFEKRYGV